MVDACGIKDPTPVHCLGRNHDPRRVEELHELVESLSPLSHEVFLGDTHAVECDLGRVAGTDAQLALDLGPDDPFGVDQKQAAQGYPAREQDVVILGDLLVQVGDERVVDAVAADDRPQEGGVGVEAARPS